MKKIIMLMIISMILVGCGNNYIDEVTKNSINKGDSDASISILVEHGIDLESLKPDGTISTVTYKEAGGENSGVIFYVDGESKRKESFIELLDYFKLISSDGKIYNNDNKEYEYKEEINDKTKEQEVSYNYNNEKIKIRIEYKERTCPKDAKNKKCDTYGIVFE